MMIPTNKLIATATIAAIALLLCSSLEAAHPKMDTQSFHSFSSRERLTDDWFGLGKKLSQGGISVELDVTQIYQTNLRGGMSTHRRAGRYSGSYDLGIELDLETLWGLPGGSIFLHGEGSWSNGLGDSSIGSLFGANADAGGDRGFDLTELYYEQSLWNETMIFRIGKLDLTNGFTCQGCPVAFDNNAFANDETSQFLNGALVNNPTIPFPDRGLGAAVFLTPVSMWYLSAGVADAQASGQETGFNTTFHDEDSVFAIFETGLTPCIPSSRGPLQGAYRAGVWYDPQAKRTHSGGIKRDDMGFYFSIDQMLCRESSKKDNLQGLGMFARYGWADQSVSELRSFWSAGVQYQGLIPGRDDDVLAFGVAQGQTVREAGFTASHETAMELYYNAAVTPWMNISPSVQCILNPGGDKTIPTAVVLGLRIQIRL